MPLRILVFGPLADILQNEYIDIVNEDELEGFNTNALRGFLNQKFSEIEATNYAIAINRVLVPQGTAFQAGDEIALLPPFSGG